MSQRITGDIKTRNGIKFQSGVEKMGLSGSEFSTYLYLMQNIQSDNLSEASYTEIADNLGINRRTAIKAIQALTDKGLIKKYIGEEANGTRAANMYELYHPDPEN